jgi:Tfp pilus assembly protein PilV
MTKKRAFTLAEALIAGLIVSVSFAGVISAFIAARAYSLRATHRLMAANHDRESLTILGNEVRADTWNTGQLSVPQLNTQSTARPNYVVRYNCTAGLFHGVTMEYRNVTVVADYPSN